MKISGKTVMGIVTGLGGLIATAGGLLLSRTSGKLAAEAKEEDACRYDPDEFDDDDAAEAVFAEEVKEPEEDEDE